MVPSVFKQYSFLLSLLACSAGQTLLFLCPVPGKISKIWLVKEDPAQSFLKMLSRARNQTWLRDKYLFYRGEAEQFLLNTGCYSFYRLKDK